MFRRLTAERNALPHQAPPQSYQTSNPRSFDPPILLQRAVNARMFCRAKPNTYVLQFIGFHALGPALLCGNDDFVPMSLDLSSVPDRVRKDLERWGKLL